MQKSKIEYLTHSWNFYTGCNHWKTGVCAVGENCWAKCLADRFHRPFEPTLHPELLLDPLRLKKPGRIGVCFTGDLFGDWVDPNQSILQYFDPVKSVYGRVIDEFDGSLKSGIFDVIKISPQHQFFFLTKALENIQKWGEFPDNAWVGATVWNGESLAHTNWYMAHALAKNRWLSIEPLMGPLPIIDVLPELLKVDGIKWIVIGGWSHSKIQPKIEWVREIVAAADKAGIPVFLKENLRDLLRENDWNLYSFPAWAGKQGAITNDTSLLPDGHPSEPMRVLRQELPK
jgi:protein gp37